jgi:hypothetical protein
LRLVAENDAHAADTAPERARARPALAAWPLATRGKRSLPPELAHRLIANYSEPGELVVAAPSARAALRGARQLGRRSLPLTPRAQRSSAPAGVTAPHANEYADLAMAVLGTPASLRAAAAIAARPRERLKPGGFLVLALEGTHGPLGAIVRACQQQGLQYWQHVVAIDRRQLTCEGTGGGAGGDAVRSIRCHRDLLVFRRPAQADAVASEAVSAVVAA